MKFVARKMSNSKGAVGLIPSDEMGDEMLRKLKDGAYVTVEVRRPRNALHHRLFFALLHKVFENQERFPTMDALLAAIKIAAGRYTELPMSNGAVVFIPESISFESLGQLEFSEFYERALDVIVRDFLPGISREDLKNEIELMISPKRSAA